MKSVYDAKDSLDAHMMADALERQGIKAEVRGEYDAISHDRPSVWIVNDQEYDEAGRIINEIVEAGKAVEVETRAAGRKTSGFGAGILVGLVLGVGSLVLLYSFDIPSGIRPPSEWDTNDDGVTDVWLERKGKGTFTYANDTNFDGRPDQWNTYANYKIETSTYDENFDGKPDSWVRYSEKGLFVSRQDDIDFDGRIDYWGYYRNGERVEEALDNDNDGKTDEWAKLRHGRPVERTWSYLGDRIIDKKAIYKNGRKVEEFYDRNRDGKFDESVKLDAFERVISKTKL